MNSATRKLAIVTGASSGIGLALANECARNDFDLILAADRPELAEVSSELSSLGAKVETIEADLSTEAGVAALLHLLGDRPLDALLANAGIGVGDAFLDQTTEAWRHVVETNLTGTLLLLHAVGRLMRDRGQGRILITGSIAGFAPGTYHAVYNASKAFLDSFAFALRHELKPHGVTVTCLMPGATETEFFDHAGLRDTPAGRAPKDDPAMVARKGFAAMMKGEGDVIPGWHNKLQAALLNIMPSGVKAGIHGKVFGKPH